MDGSHVGFTLADIEKEQDSIDRMIDQLLNYNPDIAVGAFPVAENLSGNNSPIAKTPVLPAKRGRGRPPKVNVTGTRPSSPLPRSTGNQLHLDYLVQCLNKINLQNRKLVQHIHALSAKIDDKKCDCVKTTEVPSEVQVSTNSDISERLDRLEQNQNSNVLICRGPEVQVLLEQVKVGSSVNYDRLKGNLCRAVCGADVTEIDINNLQLSVFGRDRKAIRLTCGNSNSKIHLLKQAKRKRPRGVYVTEFLTKPKLDLFKKISGLKKLHPRKIKSVFSREGNIFYRLHNEDRAVLVKSVRDLEGILREPPRSVDPVAPAEEIQSENTTQADSVTVEGAT